MRFMLFTQTPEMEALNWCWPDFSPSELSCKCGGRFCNGAYWHDATFLDALQKLRDDINRPLHISSGHRCSRWNARVGGAPKSRHLKIAVDILLAGHNRFVLRDAAIGLGFNGIGMARSFLHLDRRGQSANWYYVGSRALWLR